jgi:hypothetical protein
MQQIHPVIQEEIERIKTLLKKRGFSPPVEDQIRELGDNEKSSGHGYSRTENVCILSTDPTKSEKENFFFFQAEDPSRPDHFITARFKGRWCAVLPDPGNSCDERWERMLDDITFHMYDQEFDGVVLVRCPKMTSYGTVLGWYEEALHIDIDAVTVHKITGIDLRYAYPHSYKKKS